MPYAAPPVGTLRLSVAREVGAWDSLDATQLPPACVQDAGDGSVKGAEDCLYMKYAAWSRLSRLASRC